MLTLQYAVFHFPLVLLSHSRKVTVMVWVITALTKHYDQSNLERKGLFSLYFHITVHPQSKSGCQLKDGRNPKAEADQSSWRSVPQRLASHGLLSLLSYRIQDLQLRDGTTQNKLGLL